MASPYTPSSHPLIKRAKAVLKNGRLEGLIEKFKSHPTVAARFIGICERVRAAMGRLMAAIELELDPTQYEHDLLLELQVAEEALKYVESLEVVEQAKVNDTNKKFEI